MKEHCVGCGGLLPASHYLGCPVNRARLHAENIEHSASDAVKAAAEMKISVVAVLRLIENTRCSSGNAAWREACDCMEDLVLMRVTKPEAA